MSIYHKDIRAQEIIHEFRDNLVFKGSAEELMEKVEEDLGKAYFSIEKKKDQIFLRRNYSIKAPFRSAGIIQLDLTPHEGETRVRYGISNSVTLWILILFISLAYALFALARLSDVSHFPTIILHTLPLIVNLALIIMERTFNKRSLKNLLLGVIGSR